MSDGQSTYTEQLPWLEAVDDEDGPSGVSARRMMAALAVVVLAALLVSVSFYWLGRRNAVVTGAPELIRAPAGPYKVKPDNPGGLDVAGESATAFQTSAGEDPDSRLNVEALPEPPAAPPAATATPEPAPVSEPATETSAAAEPDRAPAGGSGSIVQLGAYKSAAQAQRGWDALSARFPELGRMSKLVVPYSGGFRLRAGAASPEDARKACQALKAAGENCFIAR